MIVAKDGSGDYDNLQDAIDAVPDDNNEEVIIKVKKGIYKQKVKITKSYITIVGEGVENTVLSFDDYAGKLLESGEKMGTYNSCSVHVSGNDFTAENITFENSAGLSSVVGQAVALYADGDRLKFRNCRLIGHQDTLYTGRPIEGKNLCELRERQAKKNSRQYYENCLIKGDVDFIFGSAAVVFNKCEVFSNDRNEDVNGFVTAASTPEENMYGYVFIDCRLTSDAASQTVYLGRPWRNFARTVFINCFMGEHIKKEGWHNWDKLEAEKTATFEEYNSFGPGAKLQDRVKWSKVLDEEQSRKYTVDEILSGYDSWNPLSN